MDRNKILIVDDDPRNIFALAATLRYKGYECVSAGDARQAFALLGLDERIALVLMDMMMAEIDGYQAIGLIRAEPRWAGLPVIAVTAQAMVGDRERCLAAGADDYLSKPIDVDQLLQKLEHYLNR
ncbi:MAG TPA: response regulator [Chitinophagaceae bacterium]|jgi:CheY-like chemotaxis protein|nr:response regulator [Chitinophagaceae bacterium]